MLGKVLPALCWQGFAPGIPQISTKLSTEILDSGEKPRKIKHLHANRGFQGDLSGAHYHKFTDKKPLTGAADATYAQKPKGFAALRKPLPASAALAENAEKPLIHKVFFTSDTPSVTP